MFYPREAPELETESEIKWRGVSVRIHKTTQDYHELLFQIEDKSKFLKESGYTFTGSSATDLLKVQMAVVPLLSSTFEYGPRPAIYHPSEFEITHNLPYELPTLDGRVERRIKKFIFQNGRLGILKEDEGTLPIHRTSKERYGYTGMVRKYGDYYHSEEETHDITLAISPEGKLRVGTGDKQFSLVMLVLYHPHEVVDLLIIKIGEKQIYHGSQKLMEVYDPTRDDIIPNEAPIEPCRVGDSFLSIDVSERGHAKSFFGGVYYGFETEAIHDAWDQDGWIRLLRATKEKVLNRRLHPGRNRIYLNGTSKTSLRLNERGFFSIDGETPIKAYKWDKPENDLSESWQNHDISQGTQEPLKIRTSVTFTDTAKRTNETTSMTLWADSHEENFEEEADLSGINEESLSIETMVPHYPFFLLSDEVRPGARDHTRYRYRIVYSFMHAYGIHGMSALWRGPQGSPPPSNGGGTGSGIVPPVQNDPSIPEGHVLLPIKFYEGQPELECICKLEPMERFDEGPETWTGFLNDIKDIPALDKKHRNSANIFTLPFALGRIKVAPPNRERGQPFWYRFLNDWVVTGGSEFIRIALSAGNSPEALSKLDFENISRKNRFTIKDEKWGMVKAGGLIKGVQTHKVHPHFAIRAKNPVNFKNRTQSFGTRNSSGVVTPTVLTLVDGSYNRFTVTTPNMNGTTCGVNIVGSRFPAVYGEIRGNRTYTEIIIDSLHRIDYCPSLTNSGLKTYSLVKVKGNYNYNKIVVKQPLQFRCNQYEEARDVIAALVSIEGKGNTIDFVIKPERTDRLNNVLSFHTGLNSSTPEMNHKNVVIASTDIRNNVIIRHSELGEFNMNPDYSIKQYAYTSSIASKFADKFIKIQDRTDYGYQLWEDIPNADQEDDPAIWG